MPLGQVGGDASFGLRDSQAAIAGALLKSGIPGFAIAGQAMQQYLDSANFPSTVALFAANRGNFPFRESGNQGSLRIDHRFSDTNNG